jgi:hypothetical protein
VANTNTLGTTTSLTFTPTLTGGGTNPSVTITTNTSVFVTITCYYSTATNDIEGLVGFAISGATTRAAADAQALTIIGRSNNFALCSAIFYVTSLTAGSNIFTLNYRVSAASTGTFQYRTIIVEKYN